MDHPVRKRVRRTLSSLLLIFCCASFGFAQQTPPQRINPNVLRPISGANLIKKPTVRAQLNRNLLRVQSRKAIPFKPFPMLDPHTRKPIAPTAIITLPNGKKPTAKQYYTELNSFEKWLTQHGYSLRTTPKNAQVKLQEITLDRALLQRQIRLSPKPTNLRRRANFLNVYSNANLSRQEPIRLNARRLTLPRMRVNNAETVRAQEANRKITAAGVKGAMLDGMVINTSALAQIAKFYVVPGRITPPPPCSPVHDARNWNWNVGSHSTFAAYVNGSLTLSGEACKPPDMSHFANNQSHFKVSAEGKAGGTIFGAGGDMLRVTGDLGGNQGNDTVSANLGVFVLGQNVFGINKTAKSHWGVGNKVSKGVDFSTSIPIPVGPFDIDVTIGAQGSVGFRYELSLYPMSINLSGGPFAHTSVYAQAGLNVVVAEAGVGASLTLVNWDMNLGGNAGVGFLLGFYVYDNVYADSTLSMLGGKVYIYAKVYYPCLDPWPDICNSKWQTSLWSWNGLKYNSVLFDHKNTIPLHW